MFLHNFKSFPYIFFAVTVSVIMFRLRIEFVGLDADGIFVVSGNSAEKFPVRIIYSVNSGMKSVEKFSRIERLNKRRVAS